MFTYIMGCRNKFGMTIWFLNSVCLHLGKRFVGIKIDSFLRNKVVLLFISEVIDNPQAADRPYAGYPNSLQYWHLKD